MLLSSHVVAELERVCDHLILLRAGRVRLAGEIDDLLGTHRLLVGPRGEAPQHIDTIVDRLHQGQGVRDDWVGQYVAEHHLRPYIEYQPNGRFWTFELIEAGIFVGLAAILVTAATWLVRRRTT